MNKPEKPVVPQFVADWYEEHKDNFEIYLSELCRKQRRLWNELIQLLCWFP